MAAFRLQKSPVYDLMRGQSYIKTHFTMISFIFPHRLHRFAYFFRGLIFDILTGLLYSCSTTMNSSIWWTSVIIFTIYGMFFIILPRIRDIGMSGWWVLAMLIPVVNVVFGIILIFRSPVILRDGSNLSLEPLAVDATSSALRSMPRVGDGSGLGR